MRRFVLLLSALALAAGSLAGAAFAHHPDPTHEDGGEDVSEEKQHGGDGGHLPASRANVDLVGKLKLTDVAGGIADVAAFGEHAYLNAFSPECGARGGAGTGVHVVDISNPASPKKVAFIPAHANSYVGEGVHVVRAHTPFFRGDLLIHNNETCNSAAFAPSGASLWNVSNPRNPQPLSLNFGDAAPAVARQAFHTTHSAQLFVQEGATAGTDKVYAVLQDNQELKDVDIFDVSNPAAPVMVSERGLEDWPGAHGSYANGDTVFHHDMQHKRIRGHDYLAVSYWDAGQILLNVDDPANPVFVGDSDFRFPDPLMPQFDIPEGNSHQSYWDADAEFLISSDEDFSPTRTNCRITTGPNAGATPCGEFGWTPDLADLYPNGYEGSTVYGGLGCDAASVPPRSTTGADMIVFSRGACFFSTKVDFGQQAGYEAVAIGQSHGGTRNGLLPDAFICGSAGHDFDERIPAVCIGHRAMHELFNDAPEYSGGEGADIPIGAAGERLFAQGGVFDGWGYVQLHDARDPNLPIIDSFAVPEALDPAYAEGFGNLTVHEVKTDPRTHVNLAYLSYYDAGLRVIKFNAKQGMWEVGHFIDEGGNDFWGVYPIQLGNRGAPHILMSDRDHGLYVLRYTGN